MSLLKGKLYRGMSNLSKELKKLFFATLRRKAEESSRVSSLVYSNGYGSTSGMVNIFFYEWSDPYRTPRTFYTLAAFEKFLNDSRIYLAYWQRDILTHMKYSYVSCKKGAKELIIKSTYMDLRKYFEDEVTHSIPMGNVQSSSMGYEHESRWSEDGMWYG